MEAQEHPVAGRLAATPCESASRRRSCSSPCSASASARTTSPTRSSVLIDRRQREHASRKAHSTSPSGLLAIAIAVEALRMRRWAWVAFMAWALLGLVHQLLRHFFYDSADYLAMALDAVAVLVLTPLDVQIAFGVRPPRNVTPRTRNQASRRARLTSRSFGPSSRSSATRRARSSTRWRSSRTCSESSLWLYVPDGADEEISRRG